MCDGNTPQRVCKPNLTLSTLFIFINVTLTTLSFNQHIYKCNAHKVDRSRVYRYSHTRTVTRSIQYAI